MVRTRRDIFENETERVFREVIEAGAANIESGYNRMLNRIKNELYPIYGQLEGETMTRAQRQRIRHAVDRIVREEHTEIREEVKKSSNSAAVIGFSALQYEIEQKNKVSIPLDGDAMKGVHHTYTARKLTDGKNYADRIARNHNRLITKLSTRIGRGVTEGEGWIQLDEAVERTITSEMKRTQLIQRVESERVKEEAEEDSAKELKRVGVVTTKTWISQGDDRVRHTHDDLDGTTIEASEYFKTVNGRAKAPHMFGVAEEDINCRCYLLHDTKEIDADAIDQKMSGSSGSYEAWADEHGYTINK